MTPRVESEIRLQIQRNIRRINHGTPTSVAIVVVDDVPITPRSIRRFMLMQEDYVQLEFSLATAEHIAIGDFVDEPLFGMRFYLTEEVMPKYNSNTGGYDYSLKFEADYMLWKNWQHCMIANNQRMESEWGLTDRLHTHAQQIADEVNILIAPIAEGAYPYCVQVEADNANEIHYLAYNGKNILEALNMIADEWSCEWWVVHNESHTIDGIVYENTIHFGKMENEASYEFRLGENVETMDIARDQQTFATRLYAYGGTQNIPEDYDRHLIFTATNVEGYYFKDANRELSLDMIEAPASITTEEFTFNDAVVGEVSSHKRTVSMNSVTKVLSGNQTFSGELVCDIMLASDSWAASSLPSVSLTATLHYTNNEFLIFSGLVLPQSGISQEGVFGGKVWRKGIVFNRELQVRSNAQVYFSFVWEISYPDDSHLSDEVIATISGTLTAEESAQAATKEVKIGYNGEQYDATFHGDTKMLQFDSKPAGFAVGSQYTVSTLDLLKVDLSYYTVDYDAGLLSKIGARRLHLPLSSCPNRYVEKPTFFNEQTVETVVVFPEEYPKLELKVTKVDEVSKNEKVEHSDGSVSWDKWTQYLLTLSKEDDTPFNFKPNYMLDGNKLEAHFTAAEEITNEGFQLGGMTFDVNFNEREFIVIRNENYGAMLPNDLVKPRVGDTLFLTGWNPRAMDELGLVSDAEERLETKSRALLGAILDGQFTFTCRMMSGWLFDLEAIPFRTYVLGGEHKPFHVVENEPFMVSNGYTSYRLPNAGDKVRVWHDALNVAETVNGEELRYKDSRVIGYELKLDKPYDTPTYIVGETAAYSRLRQLEKEITKL